MSNDNKTLADVQPGGRVRLGNVLPPLPKMQRFTNLYGETYAYSAEQMRDYARAALSAQPSPGGQGDARRQWLEVRGLAAGIVKNLQAFADSPHKGAWCGALDDALSFADQIEKDAAAAYESILAARQPVGDHLAQDRKMVSQPAASNQLSGNSGELAVDGTRQPVDDYDSSFQEPDHAPYLLDAAGYYALQSFLTVAEEFRRSAEPYIEAINEGGSAGDDEISEVFDSHLNHAKRAVSRSTMYAAPPAQAVDLGAVRALLQRRIEQWRSHLPADPGAPGTREIETKGEHDYNNDVRIYREGIAVMEEVLSKIDSQAVGNG